MSRPYKDRRDAGTALAAGLAGYRGLDGLLVLGLPRGGVPVAAEVARALQAPLDVLVVRKVGVPRFPEVAMGAIASIAGTVETVRNQTVLGQLRRLGVGDDVFAAATSRETVELRRREEAYRQGRPALAVTGRPVILVDDGLATGATMRAAVAAVRRERGGTIVVAAPVGSPEACADVQEVADELVCPWVPDDFQAVGQFYEAFDQTTDDEVLSILQATPGVGGEVGR